MQTLLRCQEGSSVRTDHYHTAVLMGALRSTLDHLQEQEALNADDPVLRSIKSGILQTIALRESEMESRSEPAA